jgi:D-alanyl-D-alanine carboxypeptidase
MILHNWLWWALCLGVLASPALAAPPQAFIVLDHDTGAVLDARNADQPAFPASLTKMMTLYLTFRALEAGDLKLGSRLRVSKRAAAMPPTKLGLKAGRSIEVEDAILGLVTRSANDAAAVLAENLGGSESRFALLMTKTARRLGMTRTVFRNASGLPDGGQKSSARDLARLATHLITDYPQYYRYFSRKSFTYAGRTYGNHNRLLSSYRGMDGLKTGYTRASGFNLAASAVRNGRRLVAVVIGGNSAHARDVRMAGLLDDGFVKLEREQRNRPALVAKAEPSPPKPQLLASANGIDVAIEPSPPKPDLVVPALASADAPAEQQADVVTDLSPPKPELVVALAQVAEAGGAAALAVEPVTASLAPAVERPQVKAPVPARKSLTKAAAKKSTRAAKATKSSKKSAKVVASAGRRGSMPYGVQVGAFSRPTKARAAAQQAIRRAPDLLRGTFLSIGTHIVRKQTLFRATLVGLAKDDADQVCRRLKKLGQGCLVVRSAPVTVAQR